MGKITDAIYALYNQNGEERLYLGGSEIGHPCARKLWYSFRACLDVSFPPRILRLFQTGHREEDRMITELRSAGFDVECRDPQTRRQFGVSLFGGHFKGHIDGKLEGRLLECKTSNTKRFKAVKKNGVAKEQPTHHGQMQVYMGLLGLSEAVYLVHCKETDDLYEETVLFDQLTFDELVEKAGLIINSPAPPDRQYHDPMYYLCTWCDYHGLCWDADAPRVDCRTCLQSTADTETGEWHCDRYGPIPSQWLRVACDDHLFISPLLEHRHGGVIEYEPIDIDKPTDWVKYEDGTINKNNSVELAALPNDKWPKI